MLKRNPKPLSKDELKDELLGMKDSNVLRALTSPIRRKSEDKEVVNKYEDKVLNTFRDAIEFRGPLGTNGKYLGDDGELIAIIRKDIEESIEKGDIKTVEQGRKQIAEYMSIMNTTLEKTPPNPNLISETINAVKNQTRPEQEKAMLQEAKNMYAHTYRGILGQKRLVTMKLGFNRTLSELEKKMGSLGASKEEINNFKNTLKSEGIKKLSPSNISQRPSTVENVKNTSEVDSQRRSTITKR